MIRFFEAIDLILGNQPMTGLAEEDIAITHYRCGRTATSAARAIRTQRRIDAAHHV